jgi:hypothetical protein
LLISIIPFLRFLHGKNPTAVLKSELYNESETDKPLAGESKAGSLEKMEDRSEFLHLGTSFNALVLML